MKNVLLAGSFFLLMSTMALAQQVAAGESVAFAPAAGEAQTFVGKVAEVSAGDMPKGVRSQVSLVDDKGVKMLFVLTPLTTVLDADGKTIFVKTLNNGVFVRVAYNVSKKDGANEAASMKVIR